MWSCARDTRPRRRADPRRAGARSRPADRDQRAGHHRLRRRHQPGDQRRDVGRLRPLGRIDVGHRRAVGGRVEGRGQDAVDQDALGGELVRERAHERAHRRLRRDVSDRAARRLGGGARADVDEPAARRLRAHVAHGLAAAKERGDEIEVELPAQIGQPRVAEHRRVVAARDVDRRPQRRAARVEGRHRRLVREIDALDGEDAGVARHPVRVRAHRQVADRARRQHPFDHRGPQPARRARDHHVPFREVHGGAQAYAALRLATIPAARLQRLDVLPGVGRRHVGAGLRPADRARVGGQLHHPRRSAPGSPPAPAARTPGVRPR